MLLTGEKTAAEQYTTEVLTMHGNIPSPLLFLCVYECVPVLAHKHRQPPPASPQSSLPLHSLTSSPSSSELALVLLLMPALFSQSESELVSTANGGRREQSAGDVIKMLRVFPGCGSAMHTHVRAATVLPRHWPIKTTLPVSSTAILMRHP